MAQDVAQSRPLAAADVSLLEELETSLWIERTRFDTDHLDAVLSAEFEEFGASGRVHDRAAVLASARSEIDARLPLEGFTAIAFDASSARVSYVSDDALAVDGGRRRVRRTSLWMRGGPLGWRLCFAQGTPLADAR